MALAASILKSLLAVINNQLFNDISHHLHRKGREIWHTAGERDYFRARGYGEE
jgi:hypothetical protein